MSFLDVRTVMLSHLVTDAVCAFVLAFLWRQNRRRFEGLAYWVLDFLFQTAAALLLILRGSIPDWFSMLVSNTLVLAGAFLGYVGLLRFVGKRGGHYRNLAYLAAFACVHSYFIFVRPNLAARNLNVSIGLVFMCAQCVHLALRGVAPAMRRVTRWVGLIFIVFCLVSVVRILALLLAPPEDHDFFRSAGYDTLILMCYQVLLISLTFALALMVNRRLLIEIMREEEKFTTIFRSSPHAMILSKLSDGRLREVNDAFTALTGFSGSDIAGQTTLSLRLWADESSRDAVFRDLAQGKRLRELEFDFRKKSGEPMTGLFSAAVIIIHDQEWIISSFVDITERKLAADTLARQTERFAADLERRVAERTAQLEAATKELESFAYVVSHDLRAPLRSVDGFSRMLLEDYGDVLDAKGRRVCAVIGDSAGVMGKLIDDLLAFTRIGRKTMRAARLDMGTMARETYAELAGPSDRERLVFRVGSLPAAVGDPILLKEVWTRLIANAIKFTSRKEGATIEIEGEERDGELVYAVKDDGAGFDMRYAAKLFGVFQRLHSAQEFEGRGVGLAIVHRIVARHGGRVWAMGEPGAGATFCFTLAGERSGG